MLEQRLRHYCRNLHCHAKLPEPVENARAAFCCRGCFNSYFRGRCLVCEQAYQRAAEHQKLCRRRQCRRDYNKTRSPTPRPGARKARTHPDHRLSKAPPLKVPILRGVFGATKVVEGSVGRPLASSIT